MRERRASSASGHDRACVTRPRVLRAQIRRTHRRVRALETLLAMRPPSPMAALAGEKLQGLRAQLNADWARLLDVELKA